MDKKGLSKLLNVGFFFSNIRNINYYCTNVFDVEKSILFLFNVEKSILYAKIVLSKKNSFKANFTHTTCLLLS